MGLRIESKFLRYPIFFLYFILLLCPFRQAYCAVVLPDTGQAKCYDEFREIACPSTGQPFYGQDGNYQGPQPAYHVSADGLVVTDLNTDLVWQRADDRVLRNWAAAVSYCEGLELGDHSDWRLPNIRELQSIVDFGRYNPAINPAFSCQSGWYWSSITAVTFEHSIWVVDFVDGLVNIGIQISNYVRCVRSGP